MKPVTQVVLIAAIVAAVAGGAFLLLQTSDSGGPIEIVLPTATTEVRTGLKVYISGAVRNPGVYEVEGGSRLVDVIDAAGGEAEDADLSAANLAAKVRDEDHWHVPAAGEAFTPLPQSATGAGTSEKIDVNSATVEQLKTLPNVGDVRAQAIATYRDANGPFENIEDLTEVSGIGPATMDSIRDLVVAR